MVVSVCRGGRIVPKASSKLSSVLSECHGRRALFLLCASAMSLPGCGKSDRADIAEVKSATGESKAVMVAPATDVTYGAAPTKTDPGIQDWYKVPGLPQKIALFNHVFWEPDDTLSLRKLIRETPLVENRSVLEIGTGTGIVALCSAQAGASLVVATDINPWAIRNCAYNARELRLDDRIQQRQVSQKTPDAWSVVGAEERFDVILSNPPWELGKPTRVEDFAFYDPDFQLMKSFVEGVPDHLNADGRVFLAYGAVTAIRRLKELVTEHGMTFTVHDDRKLSELPENFLPGMLIEIHVAK